MIVGIIVVVALVVIAILFKMTYRIAEANEALIVTGLGTSTGSTEGPDFKIVVGKGAAVIPGFQTVRRLSLDTRTTTLTVSCVSSEAIPVNVRGVVAYKVGDDLASISNAARRFLDQPQEAVQGTIHELFAGHLRAVVGGITVRDMLHSRESLTSQVRETLSIDFSRLGLVVDSLQLQEIDDEVGFIKDLGRPEAAKVKSAARIADAERDKEATQAEQAAAAEKSSYIRDSEIKQAEAAALVQSQKSKAAQAGPLAEATARQQVVQAETQTAQMEALLTERRLESQIRKPADASAYEVRTRAAAEAEAGLVRAESEAKAVTAKGLADAEVVTAKGRAEAAGIEARAHALAQNPDAVIAQQIAENYPRIVEAAASSLAGVDNLVILNGADGVADILGKVLTMGGAGFGLAQQLVSSIKTDSVVKPGPPVVAEQSSDDAATAPAAG